MDKVIIRPDPTTIDLSDSTLSVFFSDGRGFVEVTADMIAKITSGELIITEYHECALGNVIYVSAHSLNN